MQEKRTGKPAKTSGNVPNIIELSGILQTLQGPLSESIDSSRNSHIITHSYFSTMRHHRNHRKILTTALVTASLLAVQNMALAVSKHDEIPVDFHGTWVTDLRACNATNDVPTIEISEKRIAFWESSGTAIAVVTKEGNELALIMDMRGEGSEWLGLMHFKLSDDKTVLTFIDVDDPDEQFLRYRCK